MHSSGDDRHRRMTTQRWLRTKIRNFESERIWPLRAPLSTCTWCLSPACCSTVRSNRSALFLHGPQKADQLPRQYVSRKMMVAPGRMQLVKSEVATRKGSLLPESFALTLGTLVHRIAATHIAAMHIADLVHRNELPLLSRVIAAMAAPDYQHRHLEFLTRRPLLSFFHFMMLVSSTKQ